MARRAGLCPAAGISEGVTCRAEPGTTWVREGEVPGSARPDVGSAEVAQACLQGGDGGQAGRFGAQHARAQLQSLETGRGELVAVAG